MKTLLFLSLVSGALCVCSRADVIRQWDFNSIAADFAVQTGTARPNNGTGSPAQGIGGVGSRFGVVSTANQPPDPNTLDNSHWRLGQTENPITGLTDPESGFPAATNGNKTAGALFPVNTSGYHHIRVTWNQENSATASRYWRIQYTVNGTDWLDTTNVIVAHSADPSGAESGTPIWQYDLSADFSTTPGVDNNPSFAFRLVSEFESTATGAGTNAYVANRVTSNYGRAGTLWLELVTVAGDSTDPGNQWPVVSAIEDQLILTNQSTALLPFTISDAETAADNLLVSASSPDPGVISHLELGGSGSSRTIQATPVPGASGPATVTIRVQDADGKVTDTAFQVFVTYPAILPIADQTTTAGTPVTVSFITTNLPGDAATWSLSAGSSNPGVVAASGIVFGPSSASNTVTLTPAPGSMGETTITITNAGSGGYQAVQSFRVKVLPPTIVYFDLTGLPSTGGAASANATVVSNGLTVGALVRGPGIRQAGLGNGFSADNWNNTNSTTHPATGSRETALADGEYFEFTVTVNAGFSLSLASIETSLRRSAIDGPRTYEFQYSLDGFATPGIVMTNFTYLGRNSGTAPATVSPYQWMTTDTPGQANGNPTWPFLLDGIPGLQNLPAGTVITIRLYAWGTGAGADSNTVALGRVNGPALRGIIAAAPEQPPLAIRFTGSDVIVSWPTNAAGYSLESAPALTSSQWQAAGLTAATSGSNYVVTLPNPAGTLFFRLAK